MATDPGLPPVLTGRQLLVFQSVAERSAGVAALYRDGIEALSRDAARGSLYPAGHAMRLFMHDLPSLFDLPTLGSLPQLTNKVRDLDSIWAAACKSSCRSDGGWKGEIDALLVKLLGALEEFFSWRRDQLPKKQQITEEVFRRSDPAPAGLPSDLFERRAKRWLTLYGYFNSVAHMGSTTLDEFQKRLTEVEEIVLSCLYRQPSETFAEIDAILAEEGADAQT
jgi:hypothetical protein